MPGRAERPDRPAGESVLARVAASITALPRVLLRPATESERWTPAVDARLGGAASNAGGVKTRTVDSSDATRPSGKPARSNVADRGLRLIASTIERAKKVLRGVHATLQQRVRERTAGLLAANRQLEAEVVQRKRAESETERLLEQLEAERALLKAVLQQLPSGVVIAEAPSGRLMQYNQEAARLLGHPLNPAEDIHDYTHHLAIHPDGRAYRPDEYPIARALKGQFVKEENLRYRKGDSEVSYLSVNSAPIRDSSGQIVAAVSAIHDVSDRRRAEVTRGELLRRLVTSQEEERHRIARELHDQMGQHLSALQLGLEAVKWQVSGRPDTMEALNRLRELANQMGQDVHRIALELRPTALDDWGLQTALANYVGEWSGRARVVAQLHCTGIDRQRLPAPVETVLYRVIQESLTNVLKHARATGVSVIVERRADEVLTIVEDNGLGFDASSILSDPDARQRLGLLGMEERVTQLGGTLEIESSPSGGTTLFIRIPLPVAGVAAHG